MALSPGDNAPAFTLLDDQGAPRSLEALHGKTVVLYFYPRDNTPGCTTEAQNFRDLHSEFQARGVQIFGVSPDSVASHAKFKAKHELPFALLADPDHEMMAAYGAWGEKTLYGKKVTGVLRSTVVVGPDGRVVQTFPNVRVKGHADKVLSACQL